MEDWAEPEDNNDVEADTTVYCDKVELFDEEAQSLYLIELRQGKPSRMAARAIGFDPRVVREYRQRSSLFDEACEDSLAEAGEEVEWEARKALKVHEPWAVKLLAERQGWKREQTQGQNASSLTQIQGSPMERILKLQEQVINRSPEPKSFLVVEPEKTKKKKIKKLKPKFPEPLEIDTSLAD